MGTPKRVLKRFKYASTPRKTRLLLRNLVSDVIDKECIETTLKRAKWASRHVDRVITLAKTRTLHARRRIAAIITTPRVANKLFWHVYKRFEDRNGGYTRVLRTAYRRHDAAAMAVVELSVTKRTILREEELLARANARERWKRQRAGLGRLGLATALPLLPGVPREKAILQAMMNVSLNDTVAGVVAEPTPDSNSNNS